MTMDELRMLDGPGLTKLAVELGLMDIERYYSRYEPVPRPPGRFVDTSRLEAFLPDERLAQADVLLRALRTRGWSTETQWMTPLGYGQVNVCRGNTGYSCGWCEAHLRTVHTPAALTDTEAMAMLRCCVLVASVETAPHPVVVCLACGEPVLLEDETYRPGETVICESCGQVHYVSSTQGTLQLHLPGDVPA